jgi:hypothetical protein
MLVTVPVQLTKAQFNKLKSGKPVQLQNSAISGGALKHRLALHPANAKKVKSAIKGHRGVRLQLSPYEFEQSGEGLMDFFRSIKKGYDWAKKNVIDSDFYQKNIKPLARKAVDAGVLALTPELGPLAPLAQAGVNKLGEVTGAYGLKGRGRARLSDSMSPMLNAQHPAMNPSMPYLVNIGGAMFEMRKVQSPAAPHISAGRKSGGSFRPAGGRIRM